MRENKIEIISFITNAIECFIKEHPEEIVYTLSLYTCPWAGWVTINFDTKEHSNEFVGKWKNKGPEWYSKDNQGCFCGSSSDFQYAFYDIIRFQTWQEEYESQKNLEIEVCSGAIVSINQESSDDEVLNKIIYDFGIELLEEAREKGVFDNLNRENDFRIGVQLLDSKYEGFRLYKK